MSEKDKPSKNAKNRDGGGDRSDDEAKEETIETPPSSPNVQNNRKSTNSGSLLQQVQQGSAVKNIRQRNAQHSGAASNSQSNSGHRTGSPSNVQRSRDGPSFMARGPLRNHDSQRRRRAASECEAEPQEQGGGDMEVEEGAVGGRDPTVYMNLGADVGEMQCDNDSPHNEAIQPPAAPLAQPEDAAANNNPALVYNWQANRTTVRERLGYIFNSEIMSDVHFIVGRGNQIQRIPAHKFVLSVGSAVFDAMFNGGMATTSSEVELPDIEPAAFLALLKFLYTDQVTIGPETVMTTLYTAKKYAVPALEKACVDFLKKNLSSDNAFMLLTQARLFDEPQLAALCLETIDKNTTEALSAEGFTDVDQDTLCVVLERDTLGIREGKLFKAVCRWAEAECQRRNLPNTSEHQRAVLDRALNLVRFPIMTVEEFAGGPAQSGLLLDREVVQLFLYFTVNPKPHVGFNDSPRCCLTGKEQVMSRFQQIESRWGYSGTCDRIRFVVNRKIFVVGFGLYGSIHGSAEYSVNIQIIQTDYGKVCGQNDTTFQCDGSGSTFRVMFKEPVEILPNQNYTACATLRGPDSYYGTKGLRKVTHESMNSGKVTFMFSYAAGNNNGTSVEDGQIPEIIFYT